MKLWIAEKPSVAKAVSAELGIIKKSNGFTECKNGNVVTWCFGHLLEQAEPDVYTDENIPQNKSGRKLWRMQDLPIFPVKWKLIAKSDKGVRAQLKTIKTLLGKSDSVVNCGDPDREGQLLVDEILEFYGYKKSVERFWVSAQDPTSIKKGLRSLQPNNKFKGMKLAALGRSRADWLLGMNLTRALTLTYSTPAQRRLIAVGRVQTPTLALVAQRDQAVKNFKPVPFYKLSAETEGFSALWQPSENQVGLDSEKRLIDPSVAQLLLKKLSLEKTAKVSQFESVSKKTAQPKVYSLADIQLAASNRYGMTAQETLDTCQSLYEVHKVASYPRSDCQFLPESQHADSSSVLNAIAKTCPDLQLVAHKANPSLKSSVWNDKKITAHHGIIPTQQVVDWSKLNDKEKKLYELISRRYIAQFFPEEKYLANRASIVIGKETFTATGRKVSDPGWKLIYRGFKNTDADSDSEVEVELPILKPGQILTVKRIDLKQEKTKPPQYFSEGTLIAAMEKIHTVVDNPEHKKLLKEGDGIGTPATRAAIISELKNKHYLETKGKKIHATAEGVSLLNLVPTLVKNPVLTAIFERKLTDVEVGKSSLDEFLATQQKFIESEISKCKDILAKKQK